MTLTDTATRPPGRPASADPESDHLRPDCLALRSRCSPDSASRAVGVISVNARRLRDRLASDQVAFGTNDLKPALDLLQSADRLVRPRVKPGWPRPAWLPTAADRGQPQVSPRMRLCRLVAEVAGGGEGRNPRPTAAEIKERLAAADEEVSDAELRQALQGALIPAC